jgi:hypothetical protein
MKMAENIAVIVIFIFIIVISLVFYTSYKRAANEDKQRQLEIQNAIEIASRVAFLPELQCTQMGIVQPNCIDEYKLEAINDEDIIGKNKNRVYFGILGYSTITLKTIFPVPENAIVLYSFTPDKWTVKEFVPIPISIYDPLSRQTQFGVLEVEVYG